VGLIKKSENRAYDVRVHNRWCQWIIGGNKKVTKPEHITVTNKKKKEAHKCIR
jgi:hypothetical protein